MKLLTAIIRPERLSGVLERENLTHLTVTPAVGRGSEPPLTNTYYGTPRAQWLHRRSRIDVALADAQVERAVSAVPNAALTGRVGDGKIWTQPIAALARIWDGAGGGDAFIPTVLPTDRGPQVFHSR